jgi:hypothetical protein
VRLIAAAAVRFATLLAGFSAVVVALTVPVGLLAGGPVYRTVSIGFYLFGSFLCVIGFFVGNRGPVRGNDGKQAGFMGMRQLHWASPTEREETLNNSAMFVVLGFALIVLGVLTDGRYPIV